MIRVFNNRATYLLRAEDGSKMILKPLGFCDVPEKFTGDPTFRMGVKAGVIQVFDEAKQGAAIERAAHEPKRAKEKPAADGKQADKDKD